VHLLGGRQELLIDGELAAVVAGLGEQAGERLLAVLHLAGVGAGRPDLQRQRLAHDLDRREVGLLDRERAVLLVEPRELGLLGRGGELGGGRRRLGGGGARLRAETRCRGRAPRHGRPGRCWSRDRPRRDAGHDHRDPEAHHESVSADLHDCDWTLHQLAAAVQAVPPRRVRHFTLGLPAHSKTSTLSWLDVDVHR